MFQPNIKKDRDEMCRLALTTNPTIYANYSTVYVKTNEALTQVLEKANYDFQNKTGIAVLSGGDYALEFYRRGASHLDCFDINRLTFYFFELSMASIKAFDYQEYLAFWSYPEFCPGEGNVLSYSLYLKCRVFLNAEYKEVWDYFYEKVGKNISCFQKLYTTRFTCELNNIPFLAHEQIFLQLKRILMEQEKRTNPFSYFYLNIEDLWSQFPNRSYDFGYFSNAISYNYVNYFDDPKEKEKLLSETLDKHINHGGILIADYFRNDDNYLARKYMEPNALFHLEKIEQDFSSSYLLLGRKK